MEVIVAAAIIAVIASIAQLVTGFGYAMVSIPLLALATDPITAVIATTVVGGAMTGAVAVKERRNVDHVFVAKFTAAAIVGMPLGLLAMDAFSEKWLTIAISSALILAVALMTLGLRLPVTWRAHLGAGVLSGALLTSTGMNGPPAVMAVDGLELPPRGFRATLQAIFCAQDLIAIAAFILLGRTDPTIWIIVGVSLACLPVGWFFGERLFSRLSRVQLRRSVLVMLILTAIMSIAAAIGS